MLSTPPDTRKRLRFAIAYGASAKFSGIDINLSEYKGNYEPPNKHKIPTEKEIEEYYSLIPNQAYK